MGQIAGNTANPLPILAAVASIVLAPCPAFAQTDEIQVYTGEINKPGEFSITLHDNYTIAGRTRPGYPGAVVADHSLNGTPEFAYGVNDWWEIGAYVPDYTLTRDGRAELDSVKLRTLFAEPDVAHERVIYAINFEFSYNAFHWERARFTGEIRPILGLRFGPVDLIVNPILDYAFDGVRTFDFAPCERIAYNISAAWAVGGEYYSDFGPVRHFESPDRQAQSLFAVVDFNGQTAHQPLDVEFGIGHGFTHGSDGAIIKLLLTHTF